jgi:hypothetical protein
VEPARRGRIELAADLTEEKPGMSQSYTVFPMRFSAEPRAMIALLEALGLQRVLDTADGTYAEFQGASGRVAVHGVGAATERRTPGDTALNLAVGDVDAAMAEMTGVGLATAASDEMDGRQGVVKALDGTVVGLRAEARQKLDGYRVHEQTVAASLDVVAVWTSADFRADASFFGVFGFEPFGSLDDRWWCALRAGRRRGGVIGLHAPGEDSVGTSTEHRSAESMDPDAETDRPALVRLGFETSEPLDALAARMQAAGYRASVAEDEAGTKVVLADPDGQHLEIHPTI